MTTANSLQAPPDDIEFDFDEHEPASRKVAPAKQTLSYYDFGPILSHNAEWNFIVGGRGLGKTYGAKKRAVRRAIDHNEMFIYLRRHKDELTRSRSTFFADLQVNDEFPDWDFRDNGNLFEMAPVSTRDARKREWTHIGFAMALSVAQQQKSVAFPSVTTIIFDEFILEQGHTQYLPGEVLVFENFFSTVDRWKDKTKVFFLANAVSIRNPYFITYGILPDADTKFMKLNRGKAKGYIVADFPDATEFASQVMKTRFGQFIDGSEYAKFAVGNEFKNNNRKMLGVKNPKALHMFNFEMDSQTVAIWVDEMRQEFYVHEKVPPGQRTVTMNVDRMGDGKKLILPNEPIMKRLMLAMRKEKLRFENPLVREVWLKEVAMRCL